MDKCKRFYIDDAGQGFTVPCCALSGSIEHNKSITYYEDCVSLPWVKCNGDFDKCDVVEDAIKEIINMGDN